jgi:hypothetical protein
MRQRNRIEITSKQAHYLLFALDEYSKTDYTGHITQAGHGYSAAEIQRLRDRLFAVHEHGEEEA